MRLCKDGRRDDIMCNKWGFGGNAPSKLRPVLRARGASMRATRAGGTAKSLSLIILDTDRKLTIFSIFRGEKYTANKKFTPDCANTIRISLSFHPLTDVVSLRS